MLAIYLLFLLFAFPHPNEILYFLLAFFMGLIWGFFVLYSHT